MIGAMIGAMVGPMVEVTRFLDPLMIASMARSVATKQ
jgi:hypothetical protein